MNNNLKQLRLEKGLIQSQFAEYLNVTASQYSKIENGKCDVTRHHIDALAENMGYSFSELYERLKGVVVNHSSPIPNQNREVSKVSTGNNIQFEDALERLRNYCIKNQLIISISAGGSVTLETIGAIL